MSLRILPVLSLVVALVACAGGGPPKRIHPPAARIQELAVQEDGSWRVSLRVQSYSTVGTRFERIALDLVVDGAPAGRLSYDTPRSVPGQTAEVFRIALRPEAAAVRALAEIAQSGRDSFPWTLAGSITVDGRDYRDDFQGRLSPVPGLPDTYR